MLANYIYELGALTPAGEIIEPAAQAKENTAGSPLSSTSLGFIVNDLWGDVVIHKEVLGSNGRAYISN